MGVVDAGCWCWLLRLTLNQLPTPGLQWPVAGRQKNCIKTASCIHQLPGPADRGFYTDQRGPEHLYRGLSKVLLLHWVLILLWVETKVFVASFICHHSSTFHVSFPAVNGVTVLLFGAGKSRRFKYKVLGFDWQCTTLLVTPDMWPLEMAMNLHNAFSNLMIFASLRPNFQILICM